MSLVSDLLPTLDAARGLLDDVGLRPFEVSVRVRRWTGERAGEGTSSDTDTPLLVGDGKRPKVTQLTSAEVIASGGTLGDDIFEVGPLTPGFPGGGTDPDVLDPPREDPGAEVFYVLKGPGLAANGVLCKRVGSQMDSPFRYSVRIQRIGIDV